MKKNLYFDNNSYYLPNQKIIKKIFDEGAFFLPLNPSSIHSLGQFAQKILEDAREFLLGSLTLIDFEDYEFLEKIYSEFGLNGDFSGSIGRYIQKNRGICSFFDLIFFSSSTEANNFIIENALKNLNCDVFICGASEHPSVLEKFSKISEFFDEKKIFKIIDINELSLIKEDDLFCFLNENQDKKIFLSLIFLNNETGVMHDLLNLVKKLRSVHKNLIIHSDFSQAVGKISGINIQKMDLDFISFNGYKFGALNGSACLIYRKKFLLKGLMIGGGQESFLRAGTENILSIWSFHKVFEEIYDSGPGVFVKNYNKLMNLRVFFEFELFKWAIEKKQLNRLKIFGFNSLNENSDIKDFEENIKIRPIPTSYFSFKGVSSKMIIIFLNHFDIIVGSGSACSAGLEKGSKVLKAMNFDEEIIDSAVRISFALENSIEDVNFLLLKLKTLYEKYI